jgi:hypothetical protein
LEPLPKSFHSVEALTVDVEATIGLNNHNLPYNILTNMADWNNSPALSQVFG